MGPVIARVSNPSRAELESGLAHVRAAPGDGGTVELIVVRPAIEQRELVESGTLDPGEGLRGDIWATRPSHGGPPNPEAQVTLMNARAAALVAAGPDHERWAEAGDQLYVDLDISGANLPPGTRLAVGDAVLEVSAEPHLGCGKFVKRFGVEAMKLVNSELGRAQRLRGVNARIVTGGAVSVGDPVRKLPA